MQPTPHDFFAIANATHYANEYNALLRAAPPPAPNTIVYAHASPTGTTHQVAAQLSDEAVKMLCHTALASLGIYAATELVKALATRRPVRVPLRRR